MSVERAISDLKLLEAILPAFDGDVRFTVEKDVATLLLDSPSSANALTIKMMRQIGEAVQLMLNDDRVRFLIIKAKGAVFCAGGHLGLVRAGLIDTDHGHKMSRAMGEILSAMSNADIVSVSVVDGGAIGGGAELAMSTDFRLFGKRGWLRFSQGTLGVAAGWGGVQRLSLIVPRNVALRLVLAPVTNTVDASLALQLGISDINSDAEKSDISGFIDGLRGVSPNAMRALKRQVVAVQGERSNSAGQAEIFSTVWGGDEHRSKMSKS